MKNNCDLHIETIKSFDTTLGDLRLSSAVYYSSTNSLEISLISDVAIDSDGKDFILKSFKEKLPYVSNIHVKVIKSICDKTLCKSAIMKYVNEKWFSVSHLIKESDVLVLSCNKKVVFELGVLNEVADFFERTNALSELTEHLSRNFSNDFEGSIRCVGTTVEPTDYEIESVNFSDMEESSNRFHNLTSVHKFCDDILYEKAIYIEDGQDVLGTVYYAGVVTEKTEKISKNKNPYYVITIDDSTGKITGKYFTKDKNKLRKLEKVDVGSVIVLRGVNELYNGAPSLSIKGYHFCEFKKGDLKEKPSKKAPTNYSLVFPEKIEVTKQDSFFTVKEIMPTEITSGTFVVVDIETTGTDATYDKITEIGAVKIVNGVICEKFQTLINPLVPISQEIYELTGINDELVKDSPTIDMVFADFFKFLGDSVFVAHNANFDYRFLKNAGKNLDFIIRNEVVDTLDIARKVLPMLSHHKLNNLCDYYGITFQHHRALSDALATAQVLLELVKGKKSLKEI